MQSSFTRHKKKLLVEADLEPTSVSGMRFVRYDHDKETSWDNLDLRNAEDALPPNDSGRCGQSGLGMQDHHKGRRGWLFTLRSHWICLATNVGEASPFSTR